MPKSWVLFGAKTKAFTVRSRGTTSRGLNGTSIISSGAASAAGCLISVIINTTNMLVYATVTLNSSCSGSKAHFQPIGESESER